jgi:hypothetical protein
MSAAYTFTEPSRDALAYGVCRAEDGEAQARMRQAEAFCNGNDDAAEAYDGPDGYIARHVNARRELLALLRHATDVMIAQRYGWSA